MSVKVVPFSLKDAPALIERLLPVQKLSAEAYKEQMANVGKTLTALGSYWKGRKPLILNKACILGCLLPATNDPARDLEVFDHGIRHRVDPQITQARQDMHAQDNLLRPDRRRLVLDPRRLEKHLVELANRGHLLRDDGERLLLAGGKDACDGSALRFVGACPRFGQALGLWSPCADSAGVLGVASAPGAMG